MMRFIAILILGWTIGVATDRLFPESLPQTPASMQKVATSIGLKQPTPATAPGYAVTGPLSASVQAETKRDYEAALKALATYQQAGGDPFIAAERAGWLYYLKGAYAQAEQAYATANRLHPTALNPALGFLNVAEAMKDDARILRAAQAVLAIDPSNYRASMILAGKAFASHDYRGAAFIYRKMVSIYPDDVDARSGLAWGEYYTGDSHDALAQFQQILKSYPDYPYAKQGYNLAARVNGRAAASP